jgi:hypothetical protein
MQPLPLPSDHWYSEVFRAMPDLVCRLLPGLAAADSSSSAGPEPEPPRETAYIFRPVALKKGGSLSRWRALAPSAPRR